MNHMNVMWYVGKFDEATWNLFALCGLTSEALRKTQRGLVAVRQEIDYKREVLAGNTITIRSGMLEVREKSVRFFHEMRNNETGEVAAVTVLTGVHIDSTLRKAVALEAEAVEKLKSLVSQYDLG